MTPARVFWIKPSTRNAMLALWFIPAVCFLGVMWCALTSWSSVPLVDGWPVYDRLMQLDLGEINFLQFLLMPHGSHPHAIVYALYFLDTAWGSRELIPHLVSIASIALTAVGLSVAVYFVLSRENSWRRNAAAAVTLILASVVSVEILSSFQVVLTFSRMTYVALIMLAALSVAKRMEKTSLLILAVASVSVTFHGSGMLLGCVLLFVYGVYCRTWWLRVVGAAPLVCSLLYNYLWLPPGSGEVGSLGLILSNMSVGTLVSLAASFFAYYGTPFWEIAPGLHHMYAYAVIGAVVGIPGLVWSLFSLADRDVATKPFLLGLSGVTVFVALSAGSAAVVWEGRSLIHVGGEVAPIFNVLIATRYATTAVLGGIGTVIFLAQQRRLPTVIFATFSAGLILAVLYVDSMVFYHRARLTDQLAQAATALFVGAQVVDEEASLVWPGVEVDWFWPTELARLTAYMNMKGIGYAAEPASLGATPIEWWSTRIREGQMKTTSVADVCRLEGKVSPPPRGNMSRPHIVSVANAEGTVIGAVNLPLSGDAKHVIGHVKCSLATGGWYSIALDIR